MLPRTAHMIPYEEPDLFLAAPWKFLARVLVPACQETPAPARVRRHDESRAFYLSLLARPGCRVGYRRYGHCSRLAGRFFSPPRRLAESAEAKFDT